jgi:hypothetical protein
MKTIELWLRSFGVAGDLTVSRDLVYLRRTIGQSPHKFFENTRDSGNGALTMVSTRLPKNF